MVPVLDSNKYPLMPCTEKRARQLMDKNKAIPYWQKGIFCIKLINEPSARNYQPVALGIDPGSKREGYTVSTEKSDVLNITTNTPDWVKKHVETRKTLRRSRRQRKTPYRARRINRSYSKKKDKIPPSTKARWGAKLRIINQLLKILPITVINVEDIAAKTMKGKKRWNKSFSPLEVGKSWFYSEIESLGITLIKTKGYDTYAHRGKRGFFKTSDKKADIWESHNVDSHSLCEIALNKNIKPYKGMYRINFIKNHRRQLHVANPKKGIRKQYGSTVSMGMSRGSVLLYKNKFVFLGGTSKGKITIHSIITGERINQYTNIGDIKIMYNTKQRVQFLPRLKSWVSLHNFS
jgi:hypothetical protein